MAETPELRLYNTLTRDKQVFAPIDPQNVRLYVCGPTVYDFAHIGNARPVIVFDVLYRLLKHLYPGAGTASDGSRVTYVRNITDVDDKIIDRARRDFSDLDLNAAIAKVTSETTDQFHADVKALGCLAPTHEPRATDFVLPRDDGRTDMVTTIQKLLDNGNAYIAKGREGFEVLFDVASMPDYGKLSNRNLDEQVAGARVEVEAHKRNPADFVLWKQSTGDEPGWAATFTTSDGETEIFGRPGWHIECSAMSAAYLGEVFDIHGGGIDLAFPHHENEIAQSRCAHGTEVMANVWMHNGFLQVEGQKMSKSLGNFVTIHELLHTRNFGGINWHGLVVRFALLTTNYREPLNFSVNRLVEARKKIYDFNMACHDAPSRPVPKKIYHALADDLSFAELQMELNQLHKSVGKAQSGPSWVDAAGKLRAALGFLGLYHHGRSDELLGDWVKDGPTELDVKDAITARLEARKAKDWAEADRIRDELVAKGIILKDGKDPKTGELVTTWELAR
jgi:cysteinyl-tRNA synthetase